MQQYANVIVEISQKNVDRPFSYIIPPELLPKCRPGVCVIIPFGKGNKLITGYILEITEKTQVAPDKLKAIAALQPNQNVMEGRMIELAAWIREQYGSTMIAALKTVLPVKKTYQPKEKKSIVLNWKEDEAEEYRAECERKHQGAKARLLQEVLAEGMLDYQLVVSKLHISPSTVSSLLKAGVISVNSENYYRNPVKKIQSKETDKQLTQGQLNAVNRFTNDYEAGIRKTYLVHGITGSGKTEVYIRMIKQVVGMGKQVIVLIPEIALTYQTVMRFYHYFGDRVSVMNSTLSPGEKFDQCERAKRREIDIIIGPRSALFTPFPDIGLIVIDEEHEPSYKSENMPKYHAREVAGKIADMYGASVVLGSATPSVESYYHAKNGTYELLPLKMRATGGTLPMVYTIDLRQELREGNRSIFSRKLTELLADRLERGEQSMLFLNRRGYAGFISCRSCGQVMKCPHCDVSLSEHGGNRLVCHYCGYETEKPKVCPKCGSKYILSFRAGTEQIEEQLKKRFPGVRVLRMDGDTTKQKDSYEKILSAFAQKEADVLVGTQMIVKGHDFPDVTLVGILAADLSLAANDYRAGERTFALLTQAAGRAGRGQRAGEVVIQSYQPDHYSIVKAAEQDYEGFYEEEILYRELSGYPPIFYILAVTFIAKDEKRGYDITLSMAEAAGKMIEGEKWGVQLIGPAFASISKINDYYRFVFFLKNREKDKLIRIKDMLEQKEQKEERRDYQMQFDFNPMNPF